MIEKLKGALGRVFNYAKNEEPVVVANVVAGGLVAFVAEAQGDLTGEHAWAAVGWAFLIWAERHLVKPKDKS